MKEKKIAYKVIDKYFHSSCLLGTENSYCLFYTKDTIVKAKKGTLGIFCFTERLFAERFIDEDDKRLIIVKVELIGKTSSPKWICKYTYSFNAEWLDGFYDGFLRNTSNYVPDGTVCCQKVRVLE